MKKKVVSLFHAACGQRISRIRLSRPGGWHDALLVVGRDLERRRARCPRCRMAVRFVGLVPSVDDEGFVPLKTADERGLVGYGAAQASEPGERL